MENLLRAYARNRREEGGEPIELSPAVRARLQDEVRRHRGKSTNGRASFWAFSLGNWLRIGLAGAVAAVVTFLIWPGSPKPTDARLGAIPPVSNAPVLAAAKELPGAPAVARPSSPAPVPPGAVFAGGADVSTDAEKKRALFDRSDSAAVTATPPPAVVPLTVAPSAPASSTALSGSVLTDAVAPSVDKLSGGSAVVAQNAAGAGGASAEAGPGGRRGGRGGRGGGGGFGGGGGGAGGIAQLRVAAAPPGAAAEPAPAVLPAAPETISARLATTQSEMQLDQPSGKGAANRVVSDKAKSAVAFSDILATFQIERTGQRVRILDADGSVYNGSVLGADVLAKLPQQNKMENAYANQAYPQNGAYNSPVAANNGNILPVQKDGSVGNVANMPELSQNNYNNLQTQNSQAMQNGANTGVMSKAGGAAAGVPVNYFAFQVNGTNLKLNQNVTINGACTVVPVQNFKNAVGNYSQAAGAGTPANYDNYRNQAALQGNGVNLKNGQDTLASPLLWHVTGQVQVGPSNHFDLDASVVEP